MTTNLVRCTVWQRKRYRLQTKTKYARGGNNPSRKSATKAKEIIDKKIAWYNQTLENLRSLESEGKSKTASKQKNGKSVKWYNQTLKKLRSLDAESKPESPSTVQKKATRMNKATREPIKSKTPKQQTKAKSKLVHAKPVKNTKSAVKNEVVGSVSLLASLEDVYKLADEATKRAKGILMISRHEEPKMDTIVGRVTDVSAKKSKKQEETEILKNDNEHSKVSYQVPTKVGLSSKSQFEKQKNKGTVNITKPILEETKKSSNSDPLSIVRGLDTNLGGGEIDQSNTKSDQPKNNIVQSNKTADIVRNRGKNKSEVGETNVPTQSDPLDMIHGLVENLDNDDAKPVENNEPKVPKIVAPTQPDPLEMIHGFVENLDNDDLKSIENKVEDKESKPKEVTSFKPEIVVASKPPSNMKPKIPETENTDLDFDQKILDALSMASSVLSAPDDSHGEVQVDPQPNRFSFVSSINNVTQSPSSRLQRSTGTQRIEKKEDKLKDPVLNLLTSQMHGPKVMGLLMSSGSGAPPLHDVLLDQSTSLTMPTGANTWTAPPPAPHACVPVKDSELDYLTSGTGTMRSTASSSANSFFSDVILENLTKQQRSKNYSLRRNNK